MFNSTDTEVQGEVGGRDWHSGVQDVEYELAAALPTWHVVVQGELR